MEKEKNNKKLMKIIIPILLLAIIIGLCIWYFQYKKPHDNAVRDFNSAANTVTEKNKELENAVNTAQAVLDSGKQPYDSETSTAMITAISNANAEKRKIPEIPNKTDDIINETNTLLEPLDYSEIITEISTRQKALENSIQQLKQVTNPSEDFIVQRLKEVEGISGYQPVTEDNDPNGNLNKQGGYTAAVYFSSPMINQDEVYGTDIVDKGTECGGCIEVYANVDDAETRNTYLASFDGASFLNSGSHTVIGTIVIRTSSQLTATQQNELTKTITDKFLEL